MPKPKPFNILLVEDDDVDAENIIRAFNKANLLNPVTRESNGYDALEYMKSQGKSLRPLLILLDINMPKMNGHEFLKNVRNSPELKDFRDCPVVIITTSKEQRDKVEAYSEFVSGYIVKPVTTDSFVEAMRTLGKYWEICEIL